jgi:hypothetical protein
MIAVPSGVRVWIAAGPTDMRRGMQSLALQVQGALKRDPHAGDLYVFRGRSGSLVEEPSTAPRSTAGAAPVPTAPQFGSSHRLLHQCRPQCLHRDSRQRVSPVCARRPLPEGYAPSSNRRITFDGYAEPARPCRLIVHE